MKIGILGAGNIAHTMAQTFIQMNSEDFELYAIGSSSLAKSEQFARKYNITKVYGSYEELAEDHEIDLIYIATIHTMHYEHALLCIHHHHHVLIEKPMTINQKQAEVLFKEAKKYNVFISEAMWTRFMPSAQFLKELIAKQTIGEISSINAQIGYRLNDVKRMIDPHCAGGALLDIGIYLLHFAMMVFGNDVHSVTGETMKIDSGVDAIDVLTMKWSGHLASLQATMMADCDNHGYIYGSLGYLKVDNINNPHLIEQYDRQHQLISTYDFSDQITGFEYEIKACRQAIENGQNETAYVPHQLTLQVLGYMDDLRKQWDIIYPQD